MPKPMDDTRDRTKISDKDTPGDLRYSDVVENTNKGALTTRSEQIKATQNLVDKKILGSLTLVGDNTKSNNPFRNKSAKKKRRKSLERELSKLGDEVLAKIPPEKLAQLLESNGEETDAALLSDSLREKLKVLAEETSEHGDDADEDEREIAAMHPTQQSTKSGQTQPGPKPSQPGPKDDAHNSSTTTCDIGSMS